MPQDKRQRFTAVHRPWPATAKRRFVQYWLQLTPVATCSHKQLRQKQEASSLGAFEGEDRMCISLRILKCCMSLQLGYDKAIVLGPDKRELLSASSRSTIGPLTRKIPLGILRKYASLSSEPVCFIKRSKQVSSGSAMTCGDLPQE